MTKLEQAARQALELMDAGSYIPAMRVLRKALAEQAEQEPVYAFRRMGQDSFCTCDKERYEELADKPNLFEVTIFYAAPVRTKDLTDDEIDECRHPYEGAYEFARAIIAADREKNK